MKLKKNILVGIASALVGLGLAGVVLATSTFSWANVENKVAELIFGSNEGTLRLAEEASFGSGNMSLKTSVQKADFCTMIENTTTPCALKNTDADGLPRYVRGYLIQFNGSTSSPSTAAVQIGITSTYDGIATNEILASTTIQSISSTVSLWPLKMSSSSLFGGLDTLQSAVTGTWAYGSYVVVSSTRAASTTGWMKIIYDKGL